MLGRGYLSLNDPQQAAIAFRTASELAPPQAKPQLLSAYGEALTFAGGTVTPEAEAAFRAALAGQPKDFAARFYLGEAYAARRDATHALVLWQGLLKDSPPNAPWRGELVDRMAAALLRITRAFAPRPVVYRATDFRSNEFRNLAGGDAFEPREENPMIGYRGCYRYVHEPDLFLLELETLARVRDETPNLHLMVPFVRTRWELERCRELVDASPLGRHRGLHL